MNPGGWAADRRGVDFPQEPGRGVLWGITSPSRRNRLGSAATDMSIARSVPIGIRLSSVVIGPWKCWFMQHRCRSSCKRHCRSCNSYTVTFARIAKASARYPTHPHLNRKPGLIAPCGLYALSPLRGVRRPCVRPLWKSGGSACVRIGVRPAVGQSNDTRNCSRTRKQPGFSLGGGWKECTTS